MSDTPLELQINKLHVDKSPTFDAGCTVMIMTPPVGEDYWLYRVPVSDKQAVLGFRKFGTIGIGFQHEDDWNTNLPASSPAEEIYDHIKHNRLGAGKAKCISAIKLIQSAIKKADGK